MARLIFLCSSLLAAAISSYGQTAYDRFRTLSDQGTSQDLDRFALELRGADESALAFLAKAAARYRDSDNLGTLTYVDSMRSTGAPVEPRIQATGLKFRSMALAKLGAFPQARSAAQNGLDLLQNADRVPEIVDLNVVKAEALIGEIDLESAIDVLLDARKVAYELTYERGDCLIRFTMASIAFKQARYEQAWTDFRSAATCASKVGAEKLAMNAMSNLASVAVMQKRYDTAIHLFDSLRMNGSGFSPTVSSHIHAQLGFIKQKAGDYRGALPDLRRALFIRDSIGDDFGKAKILQHLSSCYWKTGQERSGIELLLEALHLADTTNQKALSAEINFKLHEWYAASGDAVNALYHLRLRGQLLDSFYMKKFSDALAASEIQFGTVEKEHRIFEQDQELKLAAEQDRLKSLQRNALLGTTLVAILIAILLYRSLRTRQRLATKEKELHNEKIDQLLSQQEMKSINAMLEGQEQERARVSKELHDHVGHLLGTIKHQLGQLEEQVADVKSEQTVQYRKVTGLLDNAADALRRISHDMAAATLNRFGLEKALKDLRDTIHINGRLQVELNTFGLEHPLERGVEIAVYRIIQESVSNVLKHAQANEMSIAVTHAPGRMSVLVSDNGQGFDTDQISHGVGLANIRSRAAALGAQVQIDSTPGKGTTVSVECPVVE